MRSKNLDDYDYVIESRCPSCGSITHFGLTSSGHERDSSNDFWTCLSCFDSFMEYSEDMKQIRDNEI